MRRLLALGAIVCASCVDEMETRSGAIIGGAESQRRTVIPIGPGLCGATLVAPNLLLTAKHCVAHLHGGPFECSEDGEVVQVDPDVTFPDAGRFGPVVSPDMIVVGPLASPYAPRVVEALVTPGEVICEADAALLVLDRAVDDPVIAPLRLDAAPLVGDALVAVGYGATLEDDEPGTLQERDVTVEAVGPAAEVADVAAPVPDGFFTTGEALCRGDSGSPGLTADGAVTGVASTVSRIDLDAPTGTSSDCASPLARSQYQAIAAIRAWVLDGFAAANATPWLEGEDDPRSGLAELGEACATDDDCRSNVCVDDGDGRVCTHGCLYEPCPSGFTCGLVEDRMRCLPAEEPPDVTPEEPGGCGCSTSGGASWLLVLIVTACSRRRPRMSTEQVLAPQE